MSEIKVASRYAKSLLGLAQEQNQLDNVKNDIVLFEKVVRENPELASVLHNPIITLDKKVSVLHGIFQDKVSAITLAFFKITIQKGRASTLKSIADSFITQYNAMNAIVTAEVVSATALNANNQNEITALIQSEFKAKEVVLINKVDPKLIGGFVIKVGDKQYDASIASRFVKLKKELNSSAV